MRGAQLSRIIFYEVLRAAQPMKAQQLARGMRIAHLRLALGVPLRGFVSLKRFGALVGAEEAREKGAYDTSTAKRWEEGASPGIDAIEAMVAIAHTHSLLYVSRAWLAFGDDGVREAREAPPAPLIEPAAPPSFEPHVTRIADRRGRKKKPAKRASG